MKTYDRTKAVEYANQWWDGYNPKFVRFDDDCTNFISQCILAGGAPMSFGKNGWWYKENGDKRDTYSDSWIFAHLLRKYLMENKAGITTTEVNAPNFLTIGDIICYDFDGDDKWQHNTIVTGIDFDGTPVVNAHTYGSQYRHWAYQDSPLWNPKINYTFLHINDEIK